MKGLTVAQYHEPIVFSAVRDTVQDLHSARYSYETRNSLLLGKRKGEERLSTILRISGQNDIGRNRFKTENRRSFRRRVDIIAELRRQQHMWS